MAEVDVEKSVICIISTTALVAAFFHCRDRTRIRVEYHFINTTFDDPPLYDPPPHTYGHSRKEAISLVDLILHLYHTCMSLNTGYALPIVLRGSEFAVPSIAAFFALPCFCDEAGIMVELLSVGK